VNPRRHTSRSSGFTLVETLVAFAVLVLALIPVLTLFTSAGKQARQTSDYGQALALDQKVAEELELANWENIHKVEELTNEPGFATPASVVEGRSPFFAVVEDHETPYGLIRPGEDPAIDKTCGPLYEQLRTFQFSLQSKPRKLPTSGTVLDVKLSTRWIDFRQQPRDLSLDLPLGQHGCWLQVPTAVSDRKVADVEIVKQLYPDRAGTSLESLAVRIGADREAGRAVGESVLLVNDLSAVLADANAKIDQVLSGIEKDSSSPATARALLEVGRIHEAGAATCLGIMVFLNTRLLPLGISFTSAKLGTPRPALASYITPMMQLNYLDILFKQHLTLAQVFYARAYDAPLGELLSRRMRFRVFMKLADLAKLETVTSNPDGLPRLRSILEDFMKFQDGRNQNFHDFAREELRLCKDLDTLRAGYPAWRWQAWQNFPACRDRALLRILN